MKGRGFFLGAVAGLALALVVVAAAATVPQPSFHPATARSVVSTTASETVAQAPSAQAVAGAANEAGAPTTRAAPTAQSAPSQTAKQAEPDSLLSSLPGEGAGTLIETLSPLIVGLLVAVVIYGAYSRRQDA